MAAIKLSKIRSPAGALGRIEKITVSLTNSVPVALWLDEAMVATLLQQHPVSVRKVDRHYEAVSGFRSIHAVRAVLNSEATVTVYQKNECESDLIRAALFELITHSLLHHPESVEAKENVYRKLKELLIVLREEYGISAPNNFSGRELKDLLGLNARKITSSRRRKTELQRIMES